MLDFRKKMNLTEEDNIIILGDAGICWHYTKKDMYYYIKEWENYESVPMLYFLDGNHENFDILNSLSIENNEGIVSDHIHWLKRGTIKYFENKKCLFIGGAESIDNFNRVEHLSWWPEESITDQDISLIDIGQYDYVFSHTCPISILNEYKFSLCDLSLDQSKINHNSENKLEALKNYIDFNQWWFGHFHKNIKLNDQFRCLYKQWEVLK